MSIADLPHAVFGEISPNETGLDQKSKREAADDSEPFPLAPDQPSMDDPVGNAFGAWARPFGRLKYYIGKFRFDVLRWKDGHKHRTEVGFLKVAVDELIDNDGKPVPMVAIYLMDNDEVSTDEGEQPVAIFTRRGIRFLAPVSIEAGINVPVTTGLPSAFKSDDGRYLFNVQGDPTPEYPHGRIVQYRASDMMPVAILRPEAL